MKKILLQSFLIVSWGVLIYGFFIFASQSAEAATNLIPNPSFSETTSSGLPTGWKQGKWGSLSAVFTYPVSGADSSPGTRVEITNYTSGDAKWYFDPPIFTSPGKQYQFSNAYQSNTTTYVTIQYTLNNGSHSYQDIGTLGPASSYTSFTSSFTVPSNVKSLSIFHLIKSVGYLSVDTYSLTEILPDPNNLIPNPSLELGNGNTPDQWTKGRWGTNTTTFSYPTTGYDGARGAKIEMTSYNSGDAKWYFNDVAVTPGGSYLFSNYSKASAKTYITVRFKKTDGSVSYLDIASPEASSDWRLTEAYISVPPDVVFLTVFHLIKAVGTLEVDKYSLKASIDPTKFDRGYVSINFDDGYLSAYQTGLHIIEAANFRSNQFIVTGYLSPNYSGYVKPGHVLDMEARGHKIGAHTRTHPDLTKLSHQEAETEIVGSRDDLLAIGVSEVKTFAYPFGAYDNSIKGIVKNAGFIAARSSDGGHNKKNQDIYALKRKPMANTTTLDEVKDYIDTAINDKTWLILLFHEIDYNGNTYAVTPEFLQEVVNYIQQKNITPITIEEGVELIKR